MSSVNINPDSFLPIKVANKRKSTTQPDATAPSTANNSGNGDSDGDVPMSEVNTVSLKPPKAKKVRLEMRKISVPPHRY